MSSMKRHYSEKLIKKYFLNNKYIAIKFSLFYLIIALVATIFINKLFFDPESDINNGNVISFNFIFLFLFFTVIVLFLILNYLQNVITKIDKSYKDLKNKEEERLMPYEFALNNSFDQIFWFTTDAKIVYLNDAACNMLGYKKEELLGKYLEVVDPNFDRQKAIDIMYKIRNTPNFILETTQKKKNGEIFSAEVSGHGFIHRGQEYTCTFSKDISQRQEINKKITNMNLELQKSLDEKEILLKEVHHRVKNNMEIISSLLAMQLRRAKDDEIKYILKQSMSRINTMALVHEFLYLGENLAYINLRDYIIRLVQDIKELYISQNTDLTVDLHIDKLIFSTNRCIQIGMILHELCVNALKYAFKEDRENLLCIHIKDLEENIHVKIRDNGDGIKDINSLYKSESIGMQLIHSIVEDQLDGTIEFINNNGLECNIIFSKKEENY
ncbi:PAS sensor-containing two-component system histidine kinase [Aliarcobacter cibarius]|uniref:histidine kinase n=1 Tax=Aliarcobacter cibarius TaxID=255507 RepID=A0A7L5JMA6_9BACT|nr:sensor histidine kinase [Aliarcobacter cibarius]QKJ26260.1 PAS sensor-containing two-component system histidine kinase [Aliarcobacter cibarius]